MNYTFFFKWFILPRRRQRRRAPSQSSATTTCRSAGRRRGRRRDCPEWWPIRRKLHRAWRIFCCKDCSCCSKLNGITTTRKKGKLKNEKLKREIYITTHKRGYDDESRPYTVARRRPFSFHCHIEPAERQYNKNLTRQRESSIYHPRRVQRWERERLIILAYCDICSVMSTPF